MKRESRDSESGPATKASKGDTSNVKLRFLIPGRAAGIIIGKQGENIKSIRSSYNIRLNIPDSAGPERIFVMEGDLRDCCDIMRDLLAKLKDVLDARLSDPRRLVGGGRKRGRDDEENGKEEDDNQVDLRLLVHRSQVGSVIGKGGERIKELRDAHRMKVIKVYQVLAPLSTDRIVQLVSDPEGVINCLQAVVEIVESVPPRGPMDDYNASNANEAEALNYGGWISRDGQRMMQSGGMPYGGNQGAGMYGGMGGGYGGGYGGMEGGARGRRGGDDRRGYGGGRSGGRDDRSGGRGQSRGRGGYSNGGGYMKESDPMAGYGSVGYGAAGGGYGGRW